MDANETKFKCPKLIYLNADFCVNTHTHTMKQHHNLRPGQIGEGKLTGKHWGSSFAS